MSTQKKNQRNLRISHDNHISKSFALDTLGRYLLASHLRSRFSVNSLAVRRPMTPSNHKPTLLVPWRCVDMLKMVVVVAAHLLKAVAAERCHQPVVEEGHLASTAARTSSSPQVEAAELRIRSDRSLVGTHHSHSPGAAGEEPVVATAQHFHQEAHNHHTHRYFVAAPTEQVPHHPDRNHHALVDREPTERDSSLRPVLVDPKDSLVRCRHNLDRSRLERFRDSRLDLRRWKGCRRVLA